MVCHKYAARENDPVMGTDRQRELTGIWSDPLIGRPENLMTGLSFCRGGYVRFGRAVPRSTGAYTIWQPKHWAFEGTDLRYGDPLGLGSYIVAYEVDGCELALRDGVPYADRREGTPKDMEVLATSPAHLISNGPDGNETVVPAELRSDRHGRPPIHGAHRSLGEVDAGEHRPLHQRPRRHGHVPPSRRRHRLQRRDRRLGLRSRP